MASRLPLARGAYLLALLFLLLPPSAAAPAKTLPAKTLPAKTLPKTAPQIDPHALSLLRKVQGTAQKTRSLTGVATTLYQFHDPEQEIRRVVFLKMMKPNFAFQQVWTERKNKDTGQWKKEDKDKPQINVSDGVNLWDVYEDVITQSKSGKYANNIGAREMPAPDFFNPKQSLLSEVKRQQARGKLVSLTDKGAQTWEGKPYRVVEWKYLFPAFAETPNTAPHDEREDRTLWIGKDFQVYRRIDSSENGLSIERILRNVRINLPLTAKSFQFILPPGAHLPPPPPLLLAVGTPAPDFAAVAPDGSTVHLSDFKGKVVVLDFWATWCGPCLMSMPHLEALYQQVKEKNVVVLAVCVLDKKAAYEKWTAENLGAKYHFPVAFDPAGRDDKTSIAEHLYNLSVIPTQYVIDKDGNVAATIVGYNEGDTRLEAVLNKLGVEIAVPTAPQH